MNIPQPQLQKTYNRWQQRTKYRQKNLDLIESKSFFKADSPDRVEKFLARRGFSPTEQKEIIASPEPGIPFLGETKKGLNDAVRLERIMGSNDLVGIPFLIRGLTISKTVGRIWICDNVGKLCGYGTGFMISPGLLMTNHHVLPDGETAKFSFIEFNYEMGENNNLLNSEVFRLNPASFYYADENLDYAISAVEEKSRNGTLLNQYGWNKLSREEGKAIISQWLNIIEHPNGEPKQIGLRENQLIDVLDQFIHYKTDTAPGSSGSPVYNERWEVVGLHHSGVWETDEKGNIMSIDGKIWTEAMGEENIKWIANEGARISTIINHMLSRNLKGSELELFDQIFSATPPTNQLIKPEKNMENNNGHLNLNQGNNGSNGSNANNGTFSWTFPVTLSLNIGGLINNSPLKTVTDSIAATDTKVQEPLVTADKVSSEKEILAKAKEVFLKRPDIIDVHMGYVFDNGWITKKRAIVVTVEKRKTVNELITENNSPLPNRFMDLPVEITGPTIEQLIQKKLGKSPFESFTARKPAFALETRYFPPTGIKLKKVTDTMKVLAHVSPEEGWKNLKPFLRDTNDSLTIAMYDFGAPHIVDTINDLHNKSSFQNLTLTLQPGSNVGGDGTKKDDLKDEVVVEEFMETFKENFHNAWVNIGSVNGWVSSSYHIKVAIRDSHAFYLSSGNYQSSNQPDLAKLNNPTQNFLLNKYNREWHAIVEHEELSKTLEQFIEHDFKNNKKRSAEEEALELDVAFLYPEQALLAEERNIQYEVFKPFEDHREFTVTPLLTPDNYFDEVQALVESAEEELYIQNQTFNAPKDGQDKLRDLVETVLEKQRQGVDVKIIFRSFIPAVARKNLEALVDMGFDPKSFRTHSNCHTKGIIVDGKKVLLGSQNWSNDGVSVNRDASLLFDDKELAGYFRNIFLHDWEKLSKHSIGRESFSLELAPLNGKIPRGMKVLSLKEIKEIL